MTIVSTVADRRAWHSYDAYLFDIDGTLLNCEGPAHYFAFCKALEFLAGRPLNLDGVAAHGNTDRGILRDALQLANVSESEWRPHLAEACDIMCSYVTAHRRELEVQMLPSVGDLLTSLRTRGATLGIATGNLQGIGRCKLAEVGLDSRFDFGTFSDAFETRANVFQKAAETARERVNAHASICVVGDTPADIRAAKANNLAVIAVATGAFSLERLRDEEPEYCVMTLGDLSFDEVER